jgi:BirA family biotin operon repressor/biotin-[acetyl-CoA-carboxylase] ligase
MGQDLFDLRTVQVLGRWHGAPYSNAVPLTPDIVAPRLRGSFGREYHHAAETTSTQRMLTEHAGHGAVALAEHQTEGRGRLGRVWVDEPGAGLALSILLRPPPPVKRWPELTLVAAEAVASAVGPEATIKEPNDVLVDGRKVAGILAEARNTQRVVIGIGVNIGSPPWPGAGAVEADRLELLVEILDRLERGYDAWVRERSTGAWLKARIPSR